MRWGESMISFYCIQRKICVEKVGPNPSIFPNHVILISALEILKQQSKKEESILFGVEDTVRYLQTFGPTYFDLIKEYSLWILNEDPEWGVKIFVTNDSDAIKQLPREQVLSFLRAECVAAVIPYLEHVIYEWGDERPSFHEDLVGMYLSKVKKLMSEYVHILAESKGVVNRNYGIVI